MKCQCQTFTLLDDYAMTVRENNKIHTIEHCSHECGMIEHDNTFDYTCSCGKFFPAYHEMSLLLHVETWKRLRAMIVCDVMLSPYDDASKQLDNLIDDIDQLINFDESELI